jgi:hypothetical protein
VESADEWLLRGMAALDPIGTAMDRYHLTARATPAALSALDQVVAACADAVVWLEDNPCPYPELGSLLRAHRDVFVALVDELRIVNGPDADLEEAARRLAPLMDTKAWVDEALENWTPDR